MDSWFDAHTWVHQRLSEGLPGWYVSPEDDVLDRTFPACLTSLSVTPIDPRGLWDGNLTLTLLIPSEQAPDLIGEVVSLISGWRPPGPAVDVDLLSSTQRSSGIREDITAVTLVYTIVWITH